MKFKVWDCKIVVPEDAALPEGFDAPPMSAAMRAVSAAGVPVLACFSGWAGKLTPVQQGFVEEDILRRSNASVKRRETRARKVK